jgi:PAS domain S-box-containing protein
VSKANIGPKKHVFPVPSYGDAANSLLRLFAENATRKEYLHAVVELIKEWSHCRCVGIRILNERDEIPYESYIGFPLEFWNAENLLSLKEDDCACIRVIGERPGPQDKAVMTRGGSFRCDDTARFVGSLSDEEASGFRGVCVQHGFSSVAVIPIRYRGKVVGAVHLADEKEGNVPPSVVEQVEAMVPLMGEALHRFDLEDQVRRNYQAQQIINSLLHLSMEEIPLEDLLTASLDLILSNPYLSFEPKGAVFLVREDENSLRLTAQRGLSPELQEKCRRIPLDRCLCMQENTSIGEPLFTDHVTNCCKNCCEGFSSHPFFCMPIGVGDKRVGAVKIFLQEGYRRSDQEDQFLNAVVHTLATILGRKQTEEALRISEEKYSCLVENSLMGIFLVQDGAIQFSNHRLAEIHGYSRDELIGMDPTRLIFHEDRDFVEQIRKRKLEGESRPSEYEVRGLTKDGKTIWLQRVTTLTEFKGRPAILGNVLDMTQRKTMEENLRASERELRFHSSRLIKAQEDERRKVALELHDTLAQDLVSIKWFLEKEFSESKDKDSLKRVVNMVGMSIEETRRIMADLRPPILDDLGVLATIKHHCREYLTLHPGVELREKYAIQEEQIPDALKIEIFRIVQEALNNIAKHSKATRVNLFLALDAGTIQLSIEDNGDGFEVKPAASANHPTSGIGLFSMRERTERSGGVFLMETLIGKGTKLHATWPTVPSPS